MHTYEKNGDVWDVSKLIELSGKKEATDWEIPSDFLEGWSWGDSHLSDHILRCLKADMSCPVLVCDGLVVDGCHRICRTISLGHRIIKAVDLTDCMPPPDWREEVEEIQDSKWVFGDMVKVLSSFDRVQEDYRHPIDGI